MPNFRKDEGGNVAMMFALALVPVFMLIGAALDYNRLVSFRDRIRDVGDSAALAIAGADTPDDGAKLLKAVQDRLKEEYGNVADISLPTGSWVDSSTYAIRIHATLKTHLLPAAASLMPTAQAASVKGPQAVEVEIKVVRVPAKYETAPPSLSLLDPEAGDYNRLSMYCYDPKRTADADKGRRAVTAFADNGTDGKQKGLTYKDPLPVCGEGELISYKLRNVRNMRGTPSKWDAKGQEVYEYWTDTTMDRGTRVVTHNLNGGRVDDNGKLTATVDVKKYPILETILCDTAADCRMKKDGGKLPNNHVVNRDPATATAACTANKFMYFGWEDRPGGDRDYDDIRVIVSCPKEIMVSDKQVHISR